MHGNAVKVGVAYDNAVIKIAEDLIGNSGKSGCTLHPCLVDAMDRDIDLIKIVLRIDVGLSFLQEFSVHEAGHADLTN